MRLQRFTQFGFGVAAAGVAVVFLSSSALAADASSLGNVTQTLPSQQSGPLNIGKAAKNFGLPDSGASVIDQSKYKTNQTGSDTEANQTFQTTSKSGSSDDSSDSKSTVQTSTTSNDSGDAAKTGSDDNANAPVSQPASKSKVEENVTNDQAKSSVTKTTTVVNSGSKPEATEPVAAESLPATPTQTTATTAPVVAYHSAWLRVQPVITNRPANVDLAAAMASAPVANKAPVPAKSNGSLGQLTVMMASIVVPQLLHPVISGAYRLLLPGLLILVLLSTAVFVFTYGLWLRRGGFATAARSDAPAHNFLSPFATPLSLGYVWMLSRQQHSPILIPVVYEILKPNRFPALSERRIYV